MEVGGDGRGNNQRPRPRSNENVDSQSPHASLKVKRDAEKGTSSPVAPTKVLNRTLFEVIRDDPEQRGNKKTWKNFKEKMRLRRAGAAWISSVSTPASDVPMPNSNRLMARKLSTRYPTNSHMEKNPELAQTVEEIRSLELKSVPSNRAMMMRTSSSRMPSVSSTNGRGTSNSYNTAQSTIRVNSKHRDGEEDEEDWNSEEEEEEEEEEDGLPHERMSLMALLAETDRKMGLEGSPFIMGDEEEDEDEEEEVVSGEGEYDCCICMVKHKGPSLIPCGHTFCRMCSRELSVQRGNCPLCNDFILEILDIF